MITTVILAMQIIAAGLLGLRAVIVLNRASGHTSDAYCFGWVVIGASAAAVVARMLSGDTQPDGYIAVLMASTACALVFERRRR